MGFFFSAGSTAATILSALLLATTSSFVGAAVCNVLSTSDLNSACTPTTQYDVINIVSSDNTGLLDALGGADTINMSGSNNGNAATLAVTGGDGNDALFVSGSNNFLKGGAGNDNFVVSGSSNTLYGDDGDDEFTVSGTNNKLDGGDGDDSFIIKNSGNEACGGPGDDDYTIQLTGYDGADMNIVIDDSEGQASGIKVVFDTTCAAGYEGSLSTQTDGDDTIIVATDCDNGSNATIVTVLNVNIAQVSLTETDSNCLVTNGCPSALPSTSPTKSPTDVPSALPTESPTDLPSALPSTSPTKSPTDPPTAHPTTRPSASPTKGMGMGKGRGKRF